MQSITYSGNPIATCRHSAIYVARFYPPLLPQAPYNYFMFYTRCMEYTCRCSEILLEANGLLNANPRLKGHLQAQHIFCTTPSGERCKQSRQHRYILDFANADHESSATANCKSKIVDGMRESVKRCMESQHPRVLITNHRKTTCFKRSPKPETDLYRGFPMGWC